MLREKVTNPMAVLDVTDDPEEDIDIEEEQQIGQ